MHTFRFLLFQQAMSMDVLSMYARDVFTVRGLLRYFSIDDIALCFPPYRYAFYMCRVLVLEYSRYFSRCHTEFLHVLDHVESVVLVRCVVAIA